jgi:hypothetical protein
LSVIGVSSASAAEPWWQLSSSLRPANLKAGLATNEVQEVAVKSGSGSFTLTVTTGTGHAVVPPGSKTLTDVITTGGAFRVGDPIKLDLGTTDILPGASITVLGAETMTVSTASLGNALRVFSTLLKAEETTAAIPVGASPAQVEGALAA